MKAASATARASRPPREPVRKTPAPHTAAALRAARRAGGDRFNAVARPRLSARPATSTAASSPGLLIELVRRADSDRVVGVKTSP